MYSLILIPLQNPDEQLSLVEAGLLQCAVKALHKLYTLRLGQPNMDQSILELLAGIGERALKSVGQINVSCKAKQLYNTLILLLPFLSSFGTYSTCWPSTRTNSPR